jgi:hypothetical protein
VSVGKSASSGALFLLVSSQEQWSGVALLESLSG